jgi:hypothetical protein
MPTVDSVAAIIAAVAALVTVYFARKTVTESVTAREDSRKSHQEVMAASAEATAAARAQGEELTSQLRDASQAELAERARSLAADLAVRRLGQLNQVSATAFEIARQAQSEVANAPGTIDLGGGRNITNTRIPAMSARLRTQVEILKAMGGPDLTNRLPETGRGDQASSLRIWGVATDLMLAIELVVSSQDERLRVAPTSLGAPGSAHERGECQDQ